MKKPIKVLAQEFLDNHVFVRRGEILTTVMEEADTDPTEVSQESLPETLTQGPFEPDFLWQWRISSHQRKHPGVFFLEDVININGQPRRFVPRGTHQPELSPVRPVPTNRGKAGKKSE